jgi:hypothetical protein
MPVDHIQLEPHGQRQENPPKNAYADRQEALRSGESAEEHRTSAEAARDAAMDAVHATAESLEATLDGMRITEDMRRTLRDIRERRTLDSNYFLGSLAWEHPASRPSR